MARRQGSDSHHSVGKGREWGASRYWVMQTKENGVPCRGNEWKLPLQCYHYRTHASTTSTHEHTHTNTQTHTHTHTHTHIYAASVSAVSVFHLVWKYPKNINNKIVDFNKITNCKQDDKVEIIKPISLLQTTVKVSISGTLSIKRVVGYCDFLNIWILHLMDILVHLAA